MTTSNQIATALLTEHFRYTPLTLLDDIINTVNELVFRAINAIEEGINNATPESLGFRPTDIPSLPPNASADARREALLEHKQNEIDNGIVALESLLNAIVDKDFDKFEIYTLRNILAVGHEEEELAAWVTLEHYKNLRLAAGNGAEDAAAPPSPEEVQLQRRKLQETTKLNLLLKAEEARNAAVLEQLHSMLGSGDKADSPLAFLVSSPHTSANGSAQPLNQKVQYTLSQLPALRDLLAQLKTSLQTLPNARRRKDDEDSAEAKRRQYLDSQSRRALERRGIEAESQGTIAAATGRRVGKDEVEGIEAVVQALSGAEGARRNGDEMER